VPQVWALYKEVQEYYEKGMRVPDDVTLLWCDDNWGNIRRLPTADERGRAGGAGIYYHFDYVGGPRSYKWLNTIPIPKIWEQLHLAHAYGASRLWAVNVGDLKPMELPIQFFLDYARRPEAWPLERLPEFQRLWAEREFGPEHAAEIAEIVAAYTRWNGRRKPEMLEPRTFSLVNYREAETVVADYQALAARAEALADRLPSGARDAFFELVLYPVKACANLLDLYVTVGRNRLYAVQGRTSTNDLAERARALFREDARLSREYNETLAGGKWRHMMDQTHIGYTYWNQPVANALPGVQEIQPADGAAMGVAIEGSEGSWPGGGGPAPRLPPLDPYTTQPRFIEVFNRGLAAFAFHADASDPWIHVDPDSGTVERSLRLLVSVDWSRAPTGGSSGSLVVSGPDGAEVTVEVPLRNPGTSPIEGAARFVEGDGYVSIEAEHYARAVAPPGRSWARIPGFGRTLSGMMTRPVTAATLGPAPDGMRLEYEVRLWSSGTFSVDAYLAPTQKFQPGPGMRYAISFDDETPQVVNVHADTSLAAWEKEVADGVKVLRTRHVIPAAGDHVLKYWALDPGLVLQKLVVDTGGLRPSYLGPPESARRGSSPASVTGAPEPR
jgi:hypothetical protein